MDDYERIHSRQLSRLPGAILLQSSFSIRVVTERNIFPQFTQRRNGDHPSMIVARSADYDEGMQY
ncbi:hypothetical protein ACWX0K_00085 [Nitrobacteraceae bacterium UC4446_H13]|jgi:hypothetical protein